MDDRVVTSLAGRSERRRRLARKAVDHLVPQVDGPAREGSGLDLTAQLPGLRVEDELVGRRLGGAGAEGEGQGDAKARPAVVIPHGAEQLDAGDQRGSP